MSRASCSLGCFYFAFIEGIVNRTFVPFGVTALGIVFFGIDYFDTIFATFSKAGTCTFASAFTSCS